MTDAQKARFFIGFGVPTINFQVNSVRVVPIMEHSPFSAFSVKKFFIATVFSLLVIRVIQYLKDQNSRYILIH